MALPKNTPTKRKVTDKIEGQLDELFINPEGAKGASSESDADSTDSEESQYSGLEEEDSSDVSSVASIDEAAVANLGDVADDSDSDTDNDADDDSDDDDDDIKYSINEGKDAESEDEDESDSDDDDDIKYSINEGKDAESEDESNSDGNEENILNKKLPKDEKSSQVNGKDKKKKRRGPKSSAKDTKDKSSALSDEGTSATAPTALIRDEYEFDSSDEEDIRNTVGNIPIEWYKEYEHIGYDLLGKKILKPKSGDQLDEFLSKMDNPDYWRTVKDRLTGQNVLLTEKDAEMIKRLRQGKFVDPTYNPYEPAVDFFTHETMIHPISNRPAHKASFIPSKWEKLKVGQIVHAIKMGWIKPRSEKKEEDDKPRYYQLWQNDDQGDLTRRYRDHIPAPKLALPGHEESYNPPPEYLPTEEEVEKWTNQDPEDRKQNFLPQKFSCLRHVPAFKRFINERFERCLDLYLCPRQRKMRMNVNPDDLIPKLPKPQDLHPFPTTQALLYRGHTSIVRCVSVEPGGQFLVSGSDDGTVKFWEVATARCLKTLDVGGVVKDIAWNPSQSLCLVAAAVNNDVVIINPGLGDKLVISNTDTLINSFEEPDKDLSKKLPVEWNTYTGVPYDEGYRLKLSHPKAVSQVTWHGRGDYLAVVLPQADSMSVLIHQLTRRRSQNPFHKTKGLVQCVRFHPTRPFFFLATQRCVRVYNLLKQELTKKLMTNVKWVSSMAVHPGGDNLIIGSYDCRLGWFDLDLSTKPYQTLRHHKKAVRQVCYHNKYPLFASASDDGTIIVCHGMVYNDLLQNPLIVPVKVLRGHQVVQGLGALCCQFHPTQPWVFSSGADHTIRLFT